MGLMSDQGFERILAIPALPSGNSTDHGYEVTVVTRSAERWSIRSAGTGFSLVSRSWLRCGMTRCYSIGWGLTRRGETPGLLLAQAFEADDARAGRLGQQLADMLQPMATELTWAVSELWGRSCLRLAADMGAVRDR